MEEEFTRCRVRSLLSQAAVLLTEIDETKLSWLVEECADLLGSGVGGRVVQGQVAQGNMRQNQLPNHLINSNLMES